MNLKPETIEKVYYSITEIADRLNVSKSCVRYWCKEFDFKTLRSYLKGNRRFTHSELETLLKVKALADTGEYTLVGIAKRLKE